MREFFHVWLYQPFLNLLVGLYFLLPFQDLGVAIIVLTLVLRAALYPFSKKAMRSQKKLQELQPEIKKLQKKNKNNQEKAAREMMALYRKHNINPLSGFLPILIQLPLIIALYRVLIGIFEASPAELAQDLYAFVQSNGGVDTIAFFGTLNLAERSIPLALLAGVTQLAQSRLAFQKPKKGEKGKGGFAQAMSFQMRYFMPLVIVFIAASLPAGVALYLLVTTVFSLGQQLFTNKEKQKKEAAESADTKQAKKKGKQKKT